jgi:hypothetical protein
MIVVKPLTIEIGMSGIGKPTLPVPLSMEDLGL